jgi:hypothetical protein
MKQGIANIEKPILKGVATMAYQRDKPGKMDWCVCARCGRPIKVIGHDCGFPLLTTQSGAHRGFQCIVCGRFTCFECSDNRYRCPCGGNAWFARVYEDEVATDSDPRKAGIVPRSA